MLLAILPVKDIPKDLLMDCYDSAAAGKTLIDELKHFLPRYIALIVNFDFPYHSTELYLNRIEPFHKAEWTNNELEFWENLQLHFMKNVFRHIHYLIILQ